jgi:glutamine cyclotransferase/predicted Ser/Thr protein kinase
VSLSVDPRIGSELFGYRLEALLGRGGMSVVYRAHDLALDRKVALKLLAPELAEDERFRSRFLRESRVAASLDHPNVIPIYEPGEAEGLLCIAMRYVEGTDLKRLLRAEGALEPEQALTYCTQVASALDAAHAHGLVHRDVKPSNVLIAKGGHCYLADFGLTYDAADRSDLTLTGQVLGSVDYAAPEQIEGKPVDGRADVYSLGCLLYECLTGSVPFPKDSDLAVLWAHVNEPPPGLDTQPALTPVVKRALAKQPSDRYPTCTQLVDAARDALPKPQPQPPHRRRYALIAIAALLLAAGLAAGLTLGLSGGAGRPKPDLTVRNNSLVRIDPRTNKIVAVTQANEPTQLLPGTEDVAVGGRIVWTYDYEDHTVAAVDTRTNTVIRTRAIGGSTPFVAGDSIAADAGGAWVLNAKNGSGVLTRTSTGFEQTRDYPLDYDPQAVAVGAGAVWVAARSPTADAILKIDPRTGAVLKTVPLRGSGLASIAVGEGAVWALQSGAISRIDPASVRVTGRISLPEWQVRQIAAGDGAVWSTMVLPNGGNILVRIDPRAMRVTRRIRAPGSQSSLSQTTHLAIGPGAVWWNGTDSGTIWRVDPGTDKIVSTIRVTRPWALSTDVEPLGIAYGDGAVWVTVSYQP